MRLQKQSSRTIASVTGPAVTRPMAWAARPGTLIPNLTLPRALGNHAYGAFLQAKLMVGAPNDRFEQEADRVAEAVADGTSIQRMCAECEEESGPHGARSAEGQGGAELEMDGQAAAGVSQGIASTQGTGQQLPAGVRSDLGDRMGADFSDVRLHTDSAAADMCRDLNAHAFTLGRDIYFNAGRYDPHSSSGTKLLAHELTHTMQQGGTVRRLTISPTKTFTKGNCGQRSVYWNFVSGVAAPASGGYIVQNVRNMETPGTCPDDVTAVSTTPKDQFWEAWWVAPGDKIQELHKNGVVDFTDHSARSESDGAGKTGHQASLGTVKFFGKDTTGDLGKEDVLSADPAIASSWKPGTKGGVARSGWLPSTSSEPSWWGNSLDGPASRWANSWWNCCGDESKHWSKSDASPS
jgi:hypothetical protein